MCILVRRTETEFKSSAVSAFRVGLGFNEEGSPANQHTGAGGSAKRLNRARGEGRAAGARLKERNVCGLRDGRRSTRPAEGRRAGEDLSVCEAWRGV